MASGETRVEEELRRLKEHMIIVASFLSAIISMYVGMVQTVFSSTFRSVINHFSNVVLRAAGLTFLVLLVLLPLFLFMYLVVFLIYAISFRIHFFQRKGAWEQLKEFESLFYEKFVERSAAILLVMLVFIAFIGIVSLIVAGWN